MAIKFYDVLSNGVQHVEVPFNYTRGSAAPIDNSTHWSAISAAEKYATGELTGYGVPYVGQLITVEQNNTIVTYVIENESGNLKKVGDTESLNPTISALSNAISANIDDIAALETKADALSDAISANIDAIAANAKSISDINTEIESIKDATLGDLTKLENKLSG